MNKTPVLAPDDSVWSVPYAEAHHAVRAGGRLAAKVISPKGTKHYVPADMLHEVLHAGGRLADDPQPEAQPAPKAAAAKKDGSLPLSSVLEAAAQLGAKWGAKVK